MDNNMDEKIQDISEKVVMTSHLSTLTLLEMILGKCNTFEDFKRLVTMTKDVVKGEIDDK